MFTTLSKQEPELVKETPPANCRRSAMSLQQLYAARTHDREKYARRMDRDPEEFRAKRRAIQLRYLQRQRLRDNSRRPGVEVELVF
jgi:hypothetical protein